MKHFQALAFALTILIAAVIISGCSSQIHSIPQSSGNISYGYNFYDYDKLHSWKYDINMTASNKTSSWEMTVKQYPEAVNDSRLRHLIVDTVGNGMNIRYDIWSNASNYRIERMHARGSIGDYYQDRDVSQLQIYTLPDLGLSYYYVPFLRIGNVTVADVDGKLAEVMVFSATDNKGFSVTYWIHPDMPLPVRVEMSEENFKITMLLTEYR